VEQWPVRAHGLRPDGAGGHRGEIGGLAVALRVGHEGQIQVEIALPVSLRLGLDLRAERGEPPSRRAHARTAPLEQALLGDAAVAVALEHAVAVADVSVNDCFVRLEASARSVSLARRTVDAAVDLARAIAVTRRRTSVTGPSFDEVWGGIAADHDGEYDPAAGTVSIEREDLTLVLAVVDGMHPTVRVTFDPWLDPPISLAWSTTSPRADGDAGATAQVREAAMQVDVGGAAADALRRAAAPLLHSAQSLRSSASELEVAIALHPGDPRLDAVVCDVLALARTLRRHRPEGPFR
jgi:hypothetical protein